MTTSHDSHANSPKPLATGSARAAQLLRAVAGAPAGMHETRRGSFMVLVVGTLALLAVISILYVTVGRGDRQMASAAERNDKLENIPDAFANYVAKIVGDSTVSLYSVGGTGNSEIFRRKTWDYPSTSWALRTHVSDPTDRQQFTPSGNVSGTTPWLASTEPVWLNFAGAVAPNPAARVRANRDWAHISNVSPDGAYVNLYNLRQNGFDATPTQMRQNLSYLNADGSARVNRDFGSAPRGTNDPHPSDWSMRQANLFLPVELPSPANVSNPAYLRYQYADTDGDGFYDARWQEMVEFRGGTNPITNLLPRDDKYRYFFATRIVDLSSMVNVNTAKDFFSNGAINTAQAPDAQLPFGLSPAEVDLFRLTTLTDAYDIVGPIFGYEYLSNQTDAGTLLPPNHPANYNQYSERFSWNVALTSWELTRQSFSNVLLPPRPPGAITPTWSSAKERYQNFLKTSARPGSVGYDTTNTSYTNSTNFDLADLIELHTFWSTNNADVMSRLEAAFGSWNTPNKLSPLRDNRPFSVERLGKVDNTQASVPAMVQSQIDLRHMLTTISGARPFRSLPAVPVRQNTAGQPNPPSLGEQELKLNAQALLNAGNTNDLFEAYADSLAPIQLDNTRAIAAWNTTTGIGQAMQTEYYGYRGPELAIIASAFMASNMIDMFDTDNRPTVNTLLLAEPFRNTLNGDYANISTREPRSFDQRNANTSWASWVDAGQLDLNQGVPATGRLASSITGPNASTVPAINVYGVEAQPFITQVASMTIYADTPLDSDEPSLLQGDSDEAADIDGDTVPDGFITINGDIPSGNVNDNDDLMCRVVAFQITNPFDVDITLSQSLGLGQSNVFDPNHPPIDREQDFYYIEFGGSFYKLSELVEVDSAALEFWGGNNSNIEAASLIGLTIPRGKSIVVYALSETERAVARRFAAADKQIARGDGDYSAVVRNWIRHQFGIGNAQGNDKVVEIPRFEPYDINNAANAGVPLSGYHNPLSPTSSLNNQVNLWRARRAAPFTNANNQHESFLSAASGTATVDGSATPPAVQLPQRNRRENDQLVDRFRVTSSIDLDRKLPAVNQSINSAYAGDEDGPYNNQNFNGGCTIAVWAMSRRFDDPQTGGNVPRGAIPAYCLSTKTGTALTLGDTDGLSLSSLDSGDFSNASGRYTRIGAWRAGMAAATPIVKDMNLDASKRSSDVIASNLGGITFANNYLENYLDNRKFEHETTPSNPPLSALRVADMLLPRALGSFEAPVDQSLTLIPQTGVPTALTLQDLDRRWVTLSEALAVAYNYEPLTSSSAATPAANNPAEAILNLYRPVNETRSTGAADYPVHDGGNLRLDDFVLFHNAAGPTIIAFDPNTGDYRTGLGMPAAAGILDTFMTFPANVASLTSPIPGTLNINTVPRPVLNTIPMMAPAPTQNPLGTNWWWGEPTVFGQTSDIAATVLAYRDKVSTDVRLKAQATSPNSVRIFDEAVAPDQANLLRARSDSSQIAAIREEPGVQTLGELMGARVVVDATGTVVPALYRDPSNIDFLGQRDASGNGSRFQRVGTESILHRDINSGNYSPDDLQGEYDQKLIPMQGLLATATTRSDYFICWFIVEGYRKEDTTKLTNADPMVPSIRRRFMMILDRSQCISPGQPARIRAIKEVPL